MVTSKIIELVHYWCSAACFKCHYATR